VSKTQKGKEKQIMGLPMIKRHVSKFLTSEEARISTKGLVTSAVVMASLGIMAETALAGHTSNHANQPHNSHSNHSNGAVYTGHSSYAPHMSSATHESLGLNHTSAGPLHSNTANHASTAVSGIPHTSVHTNAALSEAVTYGALHNSTAAGYGKHTAGTGHHNVPIASRTLNVSGAGHASTSPHASATSVPHLNVGHHGSAAPHTNVAYTHINRTPWVAASHGSHSSHGQW
jgi:hypothetical protein